MAGMSSNNQRRNQHLLWRAGFGPKASELDKLDHVSQKALFKSMAKDSEKSPTAIDIADPSLKTMFMGDDENTRMRRRDFSEEEKKSFRKQSNENIRRLNIRWLDEMTDSNAQLREKMSLFWHGHFATRTNNVFYDQLLLDIIRQNALGNFRDLLHAVSKSASMINFLNNNQNRRDHPNENFAREVMELFTLGRGNYSEQDVKESARAFTGWGANFQGEFVFRRNQHDDGQKTILASSGAFDGDGVLDLLLQQKQTARFISTKIYRFFVNDKPDIDKTDWLADRFYRNGYDIKLLMEDIFTASWFYAPENMGNRIKSPVELLVGIRRMLPMEIENPEVQLIIERLLGQVLFNPPNVAGWPGGTNWIDSSSLMFRLRMPQIIYESDQIGMNPKDDDDGMMGMKDSLGDFRKNRMLPRKGGRFIRTQIHWDDYFRYFRDTADDDLFVSAGNLLLQLNASIERETLEKYLDSSSRESRLKTMTIRLMGTPEYQLC
jgi:uncharacterized protein (DUF1800 family)